MCALIQVQHILSICYGSTTDKDLLPPILHRNTKVSESLIRWADFYYELKAHTHAYRFIDKFIEIVATRCEDW